MTESGIYHKAQGEGQPIIVIHGLFGSLENLGVIARNLAKHYRVYSIDLPNHGRSAHTTDMSLASMASQISAWMVEQDIAQAIVLGHSLGGKVAMELALSVPEKVSRLIVADIAPVAYGPRHDDVFAAFKAVNVDTVTGRTEADEQMSVHVKEQGVRSFLLKNLVKEGERWQWRVNLPGIIEGYPHVIGPNSAHFAAFDKPTLFIKGELSSYIQPGHRDEILSRFPKSEVKIIVGTEHWLHAEKPEVFSRIVERFLVASSA